MLEHREQKKTKKDDERERAGLNREEKGANI
jgi:hypothetical protein